MALSFIGKSISLISHSDVRYRGTLAGIDPVASTIQLSNVYSMGTESRRPPNEFIPPVQEPYQYIIFRASEVKDLAVDEPVPQRSVHDDPAVLGASTPGQTSTSHSPYPTPSQAAPSASVTPAQVRQQPNFSRQGPQSKPASVTQQSPQTVQAPVQPTQQHPSSQSQPQQTQQPRQPRNKTGGQTRRPGGGASVQNAAASLETVERALGDLRVSNAQNGAGHSAGGGTGKRTGGGRQQQQPIEQIKVPSTDFDFESMNAKFNKAALARQETTVAITDGITSPDPESGGTPSNDSIASEKKKEPAYNRQRSFFDSLSSSTSTPSGGPGGAGGRGGRRGGAGGAGSAGRNRREEERERNVATFGEPGGVGLMGPGAYVGGWGGYGRRGGRPRRGGASGHGVPARG